MISELTLLFYFVAKNIEVLISQNTSPVIWLLQMLRRDPKGRACALFCSSPSLHMLSF